MIAVNSRDVLNACSIGFGYSLSGRNLLASVRSIRLALLSVLFYEETSIAELCKTTIPLFYSGKLSQVDLICLNSCLSPNQARWCIAKNYTSVEGIRNKMVINVTRKLRV